MAHQQLLSDFYGAGEGMVAVVRGLPDASLAVTLLDDGRHYTLMPKPKPKPTYLYPLVDRQLLPTTQTLFVSQPANASQLLQVVTCPRQEDTYTSTLVPHMNSTTDACTEAVERCDTSAQASDGRYTTSYKVAHCHVSPTSPPLDYTEFPPQRADTTKVSLRGNFEVGGLSSGETTCRPLPTKVEPNRIVACPCLNRKGDRFASSLRKYPNCKIDRSTEIVQNLIAYTHSKDQAHDSNRTKTIGIVKASTNLAINESKNIQTYTRCNKKQKANEPVSKDEVKKIICDINKELLITEIMDSEEKDSDDSFDYYETMAGIDADNSVGLLAIKKAYAKEVDVRCLCNMTKCIREKIKEICDATEACVYAGTSCTKQGVRLKLREKDKNLSELHKSVSEQEIPCTIKQACLKLCEKDKRPPKSFANQENTGKMDIEIQAAANMCSKEVSTVPRSEPSRLTISVPLSSTSSCGCICSSPQNTQCPSTKAAVTFTEQTEFCCCKAKKKSQQALAQDYSGKIREAIRLWNSELPIHSNETVTDRLRRDTMMAGLSERVEELARIYQGNELEAKLKDDILKFVRGLPMWSPESSRDQESFRVRITEALLHKLGDGLGIGTRAQKCSDPTCNPCSGTPVVSGDILDNAVVSLMQNVPISNTDSEREIVRRNLSARLRHIAENPPADGAEFRQAISNEIAIALRQWNLENDDQVNNEQLDQMAMNLVNLVMDTTDDESASRNISSRRVVASARDYEDFIPSSNRGFNILDSRNSQPASVHSLSGVNTQPNRRNIPNAQLGGMISSTPITDRRHIQNTQQFGGLSGVSTSPNRRNIPNAQLGGMTTSTPNRRNIQNTQQFGGLSGGNTSPNRRNTQMFENAPISYSPTNRRSIANVHMGNLSNPIPNTSIRNIPDRDLEKLQNYTRISSKREIPSDEFVSLFSTKYHSSYNDPPNIGSVNVSQSDRTPLQQAQRDQVYREISTWLSSIQVDCPSNSAHSLGETLLVIISGPPSLPRLPSQYHSEILAWLSKEAPNLPDPEAAAKKLTDKVKVIPLASTTPNQVMNSQDVRPVSISDSNRTKNSSKPSASSTPNRGVKVEMNPKDRRRWNTTNEVLGTSDREPNDRNEQSMVDEIQSVLDSSSLQISSSRQKSVAEDISMEVMRTGSNADIMNAINSILQNATDSPNTTTEPVARLIIDRTQAMSRMTSVNSRPRSQNSNGNASASRSSPNSSQDDRNRSGNRSGGSKKPNVSQQLEQSYRDELANSISEVLNEESIRPKNSTQSINNLSDRIISIDKRLQGDKSDRFGKTVEPEISKWLKTECEPSQEKKLNTTIERLKRRFQKIQDNMAQREVSIDVLVRKQDEKYSQAEANKTKSNNEEMKNRVTEWVEELPLRSAANGPESQKQKEIMATELTEEMKQLQLKQKREKLTQEKYYAKVRERVEEWIKTVPLQSANSNRVQLATTLAQRVASLPSEYIETSGGPQTEKLESDILKWLKNSPVYRQITAEERRQQTQLVPVLAKRLRTIQAEMINTSLDDPVVGKKITDEVINFLKNFPLEENYARDEVFLKKCADDLLDVLKYGDLNESANRTVAFENEAFENIVSEWITNLPLPERKTLEQRLTHEDVKSNFIKHVDLMRAHSDEIDENIMTQELMNMIKIFPIPEEKKRDTKYLNEQASDLVRRLRAVPYDKPSTTNFKQYIMLLAREIIMWIDSLPELYADIEGERGKKEKLANTLAERIFMVQIRHPSESDQVIYEEELYQVIKRWLVNLKSLAVESNKHIFTIKLMMKVNNLENRMSNAVSDTGAKKCYREKYIQNLAKGGVPFEALNDKEEQIQEQVVDNLANSFIRRNYNLGDESQKTMYRHVLCEEIRDFFNYVETISDENVNFAQLKLELEDVLKQIPVPNLESVREQTRLKRTWKIITEWYKTLPVESEETQEEIKNVVQMLNYLNAKLNKIRKYVKGDWNERMRMEILLFLQSIRLEPSDDQLLNILTNELMMEFLEATPESIRSRTHVEAVAPPFQPSFAREEAKPFAKLAPQEKSIRFERDALNKSMDQPPSGPSFYNRTADQTNIFRPKERIEKRLNASAPTEYGPSSKIMRSPTQLSAVQDSTQLSAVHDSYYDRLDRSETDPDYLRPSLEGYGTFRDKAPFNSSIMPLQGRSPGRSLIERSEGIKAEFDREHPYPNPLFYNSLPPQRYRGETDYYPGPLTDPGLPGRPGERMGRAEFDRQHPYPDPLMYNSLPHERFERTGEYQFPIPGPMSDVGVPARPERMGRAEFDRLHPYPDSLYMESLPHERFDRTGGYQFPIPGPKSDVGVPARPERMGRAEFDRQHPYPDPLMYNSLPHERFERTGGYQFPIPGPMSDVGVPGRPERMGQADFDREHPYPDPLFYNSLPHQRFERTGGYQFPIPGPPSEPGVAGQYNNLSRSLQRQLEFERTVMFDEEDEAERQGPSQSYGGTAVRGVPGSTCPAQQIRRGPGQCPCADIVSCQQLQPTPCGLFLRPSCQSMNADGSTVPCPCCGICPIASNAQFR